MKVLMICVGSRGDAEPFCALAAKLIEGGKQQHSVEFFCQPELQSLIPKSDAVTIHSLPFTQYDFYKYAGAPSKGTDHPNPRVRFVGAVADIIAELVLPCCYNQVLPVAKTCQVMVTSALARSLCFALTEKLSIPTVLVHLQPLVPTKLYPHSSDSEGCLAAISKYRANIKLTEEEASMNEQSYWMLERFQYEFLQDAIQELSSQLEIAMLTWEVNRKILLGNNPNIYVVNSFLDQLIPATPQALNDDDDTDDDDDDTAVGPQVLYVGPLADHYIPSDFTPDPLLQTFLEAGGNNDNDDDDDDNQERPVCIGYGSMPYNQVSLLLEVVYKLKRRTVLVGKALELPKKKDDDIEENFKEWIDENVFHIHESAPYAWLLPQCSMMLCHGGAGVVHATLRAGIPVVISPFMGDQFFFAPLVTQLGLGARAGATLAEATKDDFLQAIEAATGCIPAAREFGRRVRRGTRGVDRMVQLLEETIVKAKN